MATTPKNCRYPVGTLNGKRFVGYKIIRVDPFAGSLWGLYQKGYEYPKGFIEGKTCTLVDPSKPALCENGWHAWRTLRRTRNEIADTQWHTKHFRLFVVEIWGDVEIGEDKFVGSHMRVLYEIPINWYAKKLLPVRTCIRAWNRYLDNRKGNKS